MPNKEVEAWYRQRRYLHFDRPTGYRAALAIVTNPAKVTAHSFYPLISYEINTFKIQKSREENSLNKKSKTRPIAYAAHVDSHIYAYYAAQLDILYEKYLAQNEISDCVLAFRKLNQSNVDFAKYAFDKIRARKSCSAVGMDVTGFFDNLDHKHLKSAWKLILGTETLPPDHYAVYSSITKFAIVDRGKLYSEFGISPHNPKHNRHRVCSPEEFRTRVRKCGLIKRNAKQKGIPQGTPISAILSNIYMASFDLAVKNIVGKFGGEYMRYCDDILVIVPVSRRRSISSELSGLISELGLTINESKTECRTFRARGDGISKADKPLQYLGFTFDGDTVLLRSASLARYSQRMRKGVRLAKSTTRRWNAIRSRQGRSARPIYRRKLYQKYSHLGKNNFLRYGYNAADKMDSSAIRGQLKPLWQRLKDEIDRS